MKGEEEGFGLTKKDAEENSERIAPLYMAKTKRLVELASGPNGTSSKEYTQLKAEAEALEARMTWIRDWYSLGVWESMEEDSRLLRASMKEVNSTTSALVRSSRILEALTLFLMAFAALTAGYTALGANSLFGRVFPVLVVILTAVVAYWITFRLPRVRVQPVNSETNSEATA